jgi:opacity protein-like surface antigen
VTLGSDLSGTVTNPMLTAGAGLGVRIAGPLAVDLQYRFGRIMASDDSSNVQRFGIGVGFEF